MTDLETAVRDGLDHVAGLVSASDDAWLTFRRRAAQPVPRHRLRLGLSLAGIAAATAGIVIGAISLTAGGSSGGLAVSSGITVTLLPSRHLSSDQLRQAGVVLARRLTDAKIRFGHVTVLTGHGQQELTLKAPQRSLPAVAAIAHTRGVLQFRRALSVSQGAPDGRSGRGHQSRISESPTLSGGLMRSYQRWNCDRDPNPNHGNDVADDFGIACSTDGSLKYLLAPTAVDGSEVKDAASLVNTAASRTWVVDVQFRPKGATDWHKVTDKAASVNGGRPPTTACSPPKGCNTVAIVLDGVALSAPYISQPGGITGGQAQISGDFTQKSATQLAAILKGGTLPAVFTVAD